MNRSIAKAARRLAFRCQRALWESSAGQAASTLRGKGLEFDEVRAYQVGDSFRDIDWKVTARRGAAYVKRFVEERQRTVWLVLDETRSMEAGGGRSKRVAAIEALSVLALAAAEQDDRVGLLTFGSRALAVPARSGRSHAVRLIADMLDADRVRGEFVARGLDDSARRFRRLAKQRSLLFVASDFLFEGGSAPLDRLCVRHDVTAVLVLGAWDVSLPALGPALVEDSESGERRWVDCASGGVRERYERQSERRRSALSRSMRERGGSFVAVEPAEDGVTAILRHFRRTKRSA